MKKIIFRVDDRLIHGQVIEGWVKYYKIHRIMVVSDRIAGDSLQRMIYQSALPSGCTLEIMGVDQFVASFDSLKNVKDYTLVLMESVDDLARCTDLIDNDVYVNIGCVACREHKVEVSNTVFLDLDEIEQVCSIRDMVEVYIHKVPWEPSVEIRNFSKLLKGGL
ncbi:PTS system mannose/fructose/N-acetylgalactosamine-transporter subunit IIB [Geovibrio ferrireducens]|jgi:mannose/fructose/N-acetylgalactosamine-specific phosphotransferase system component IIB|uniref:PTS system mannose/fructose/N-acetylgalactosamine-transporter subunit IIB n=1 Tax=Geovibrio ferrireducens TaxID=46201 RepID=UPI0022452FF7|nr:PTS sugar transporter subunit IIB [Geovibrio ferrireducens]